MNGVSKITVTEDVALITFGKIPFDTALIARIFQSFADAGVNIDMISQTAPQSNTVSLSFTILGSDLVRVLETSNAMRKENAAVVPMVSSGNCKIQLYGEEMRMMCGVAGNALAALAKANIGITIITTSEVDISVLVNAAQLPDALQTLENAFGVHAQD